MGINTQASGVNIVNCMWIFTHKENDKGNLQKHKARLVGDGKSQEVGVDCDEFFNPVVRPTIIHTMLGLAMAWNWSINQLDVKNSFYMVTYRK